MLDVLISDKRPMAEGLKRRVFAEQRAADEHQVDLPERVLVVAKVNDVRKKEASLSEESHYRFEFEPAKFHAVQRIGFRRVRHA